MPTYLTPGVYVEEVPSTSKPIEGVGTSIAAFVGLAPGGPVNTPMRISNWTQFAKIFGDPNEPDNGPFMEGAYLAHSVYGFFQNGGGLCWVVRVGAGDGAGGAPAGGAAGRGRQVVEAFRAEALKGVDGEVKVEISEEPRGRRGRRRPDLQARRRRRPDGKEEYEGLTLKKGRKNLATKVNAASKLIKIARRPACPTPARPPAPTRSRRPASAAGDVKATDFEGDVARRKGMGGLAAVDEITMVCMPDLMTLAATAATTSSCATCRAR